MLSIDGVECVEAHGDELSIGTIDGTRTISPVVAALNRSASVGEITLRTPTLDDVFLELTGHRIEPDQTDDDTEDDDR